MRRISSQLVQTILALVLSLAAAVSVTWLVPSLTAASVNMLFRFRGQVAPPADILIVGIDDASLQQVGTWPWPRSVMASVLDRISEARPRAIGLDVVYAERSAPSEDRLLSEAIRRSGRVVLPAQLIELEAGGPTSLRGSSSWLLPAPGIGDFAAATGHAHADPDVDGVLRTAQLSKSDARGARLWAFGLETLRVAEQIPAEQIEETAGALRLGRYAIAIHDEAEQPSLPGVQVIRPNEMIVNYLGPPGTFHSYSIGDVIDGKVPAESFKDKIVLVGAVAQTMGDTRITPFISYGGFERQGGAGMPGVEVHANVIETIRRGAWLHPRPDWLGFMMALLVILSASVLVRLLDGWRAIAGLCALFALIITGSLYAFNRHFIIPPVVPMLTGFLTVVPLLLLNSSIAASHDLDRKLKWLARIQKSFMSHRAPEDSLDARLSFLGSMLRADTVALFGSPAPGEPLQLRGCSGPEPVEGAAVRPLGETGRDEAPGEDSPHTLRLPLADGGAPLGLLLVRRTTAAEPFSESERRLAQQFAATLAEELSAAGHSSKLQGTKPHGAQLSGPRLRAASLPVALPHNIAWKLRAVDEIASHLIARIGFMNRLFASMTDGLLVADITGQVVFANPAALPFWDGLQAEALAGRSLTELFVEQGIMDEERLRETMREVLSGQNVLLDVELRGREGRFYTLQCSTVLADDHQIVAAEANGARPVLQDGPRIIGLIVLITDVTKRRELERVKAETLQLVSHELRTPLTSIRALSELLLKYPVPEDRSPEILETLYSEAVRMSELMNRYLDVTRIESGAHLLARGPIAANNLVTECVRMLSGLAAEKRIEISLRLAEPGPTLFGDGQLLTQAVNNLVSNAIKYSPAGSQVEIGTALEAERVRLSVRDAGLGIPKQYQARVFEKFYRLERDAQSDVVGTGLGLPLVKEIIERHGGEVTLESEPQQGSTFTIHLPLHRA